MNPSKTTKPLAQTDQEENHPEQYYRNLWSSERWGSARPNEDEQLRAAAIIELIEKYVVPSLIGPIQILDLGCGRGWLAPLLSRYGSVMGIDPVAAAVKRAKELFPDLAFHTGDATDLLATSGVGPFRLVVSSEVIEHVLDEKKKDFLSSIRDLLTPDGFAILTTPRGELWQRWKRLEYEEQPIEQWITERNLDVLCKSVGFEVTARDRVFLPRFSYNLASRIANSKILFDLSKVHAIRYYCGLYQVLLLRRR